MPVSSFHGAIKDITSFVKAEYSSLNLSNHHWEFKPVSPATECGGGGWFAWCYTRHQRPRSIPAHQVVKADRATANSTSNMPKVATMEAPVGMSSHMDAAIPSRLAAMLNIQPKMSRARQVW